MKTDNHFIYIGDCVNKLKWFKMRSFFIKKGILFAQFCKIPYICTTFNPLSAK